MIRFVWDNDAIEHIQSRQDYDELKDRILALDALGDIRAYYSEVSFLELIKGVNQQNFERLKAVTRNAYDLCGKGHLLLYPDEHLRVALGIYDRSEVQRKGSNLIREIKFFVDLPSIGAFKTAFDERASFIAKNIGAIYESSCASTRVLNTEIDGIPKNTRKRMISTRDDEAFFRLFYRDALSRFSLNDCVDSATAESVDNALPSLKQFSSVFYSLLLKRLFDQKQVQPSDFFDIQKVVYLDLCDYIVTDDRRFRVLFDESRLASMAGRAISHEEFLLHLESPYLRKQKTDKRYHP
ncbi:hypothetical protein KQH82_01115 [bacterium]|nr:hypothetical protein [bacterium]